MSAALGVATPAPGGATGGERPIWGAVATRLSEALFGEFEILGELGEGGMAAVFLAHEFALNRRVALKVMSPALMMGEGMVERFRQEAVTQANLQHANIVGVHGVRNVDDLHFFVMQFVPGRTLQQVLRSELSAGRLLAIPVVQAILYEAGNALMYAHRRGVIHRDVKPGNILLNADGDAVVTDFGIAKVTEAPSQTMTGTVVGTPTYMSPEQCYAYELTPASDQYSLGVVAYELLTGRPPFSGNSFVVMAAHTRDAPQPISELRPDCPAEIAAAVMRMLEKKHEDRFADLGDALAALDAKAPSMRDEDPLRRELRRLADVQAVQAKLADILRYPLSPPPRSKGGGSSDGALPALRSSPGSRPITPPPTSGAHGARPPATPAPRGLATPLAGNSAATDAEQLSATRILSGDASEGASASGAGAPVARAATAAPPSGDQRIRRLLTLSTIGLTAVAVAGGIYVMTRPAAPAGAGGANVAVADSSGTGGGAADQPTETAEPRTEGGPVTPAAPDDAPAPSAPAKSAQIVIDGTEALVVGDVRRFTATLDDGSGARRAAVKWSSSAPAVATVDARTGAVRAVAAGAATISARGEGTTATIALVVSGKTNAGVAASAQPTDAARGPREPVSSDPVPAVSRTAPPPAPSTSAPPPPAPVATVSAEELLSQAQRTLASYGDALSSRDTSRIRRAFPGATPQLLGQWQSMYDATSEVRVSVSDVQAVDGVAAATGGVTHFRVTQVVSFNVSGSRKTQSQKTSYTATLRREGGGWVLAGISDR